MSDIREKLKPLEEKPYTSDYERGVVNGYNDALVEAAKWKRAAERLAGSPASSRACFNDNPNVCSSDECPECLILWAIGDDDE